MAQVCQCPALMVVKTPAGESVWPTLLFPQQAAVPSIRKPQLCQSPVLTVVKTPAGELTGDLYGPTSTRSQQYTEASASSLQTLLSPQQAAVPSVWTPQVCQVPALTVVKVAAGDLV